MATPASPSAASGTDAEHLLDSRVVETSDNDQGQCLGPAVRTEGGGGGRGLGPDQPRVRTVDEVLGEIGVGWAQVVMTTVCGLAFMADAMEVSALGYLSSCAGDAWGLTGVQISSISGTVFAGELCGAMVLGRLSDLLGRRRVLVGSCIAITVGGLLSAAAPSFVWLLVFRSLVGFGIGGMAVAFDLLAEFVPAHMRGRLLIVLEFFWCGGSIFVAGMAWVILSNFGDNGWRLLAIVASAPVLAALASIAWQCESPRWLVSQGRHEEAADILKQVAAQNEIDLGEFTLRSTAASVNTTRSAAGVAVAEAEPAEEEDVQEGDFLELFHKDMRRTTACLWIIYIGIAGGYIGIILFITRLFSIDSEDDDDEACSFAYADLFISACAEILGVLVVVFTIDHPRIGRKQTLGWASIACAVTVALLAFRWDTWVLTVLATLSRAAIMASSSTGWVVTPELLPTRIRSTGHATANSVGRLAAFAAPYLTSDSVPRLVVVCVLAGIQLLTAATAFMLPFETAGMNLVESHAEVAEQEQAQAQAQTQEERAIGEKKNLASLAPADESSYAALNW